MKKITGTLKIVILFMAFFIGSYAVGQDLSYYAFIPNEAGDIDRDGFDIGYYSVFAQWDLNGDGDISETEFYTVIFQRLDSNNNGSLSSREWNPGQKYLFATSIKNNKKEWEKMNSFTNTSRSNSQNTNFKSLDINNDKMITWDEFDGGIRVTGYFDTYDSNLNGRLNQEELNIGVYNSMDLDGNGIITREEFGTVKYLFID